MTLSVATWLMREWNGVMQVVEVTPDGFVWRGTTYRTLSAVACAITGTKWSGPKFFGLGGRTRSASKVSERSLVRKLAGGAVNPDGGSGSMSHEKEVHSANGAMERSWERDLAGDALDLDGAHGARSGGNDNRSVRGPAGDEDEP